MAADLREIQERLETLEQRLRECEEGHDALLRGLQSQWPEPREAARRGAVLAAYAVTSGDPETGAGVLRALGMPEGDLWSVLEEIIEAHSGDPEETFAALYEPEGMEER